VVSLHGFLQLLTGLAQQRGGLLTRSIAQDRWGRDSKREWYRTKPASGGYFSRRVDLIVPLSGTWGKGLVENGSSERRTGLATQDSTKKKKKEICSNRYKADTMYALRRLRRIKRQRGEKSNLSSKTRGEGTFRGGRIITERESVKTLRWLLPSYVRTKHYRDQKGKGKKKNLDDVRSYQEMQSRWGWCTQEDRHP